MYTKDLRSWVKSLKEHDLILSKKVYEENFQEIKEATFYQLLARLCDEGYVGKISKGFYYKPKKKNYKELPKTEAILDFLTAKKKKGMIVGGKLFNDLGLISTEVENIDLYTSLLEIKTYRQIRNITIRQIDVDFRQTKIRKAITAFEIAEHIDEYQDVDQNKMKEFFVSFAETYDDETIGELLNKKSYKKRNIATIKIILDSFGIENNLHSYLNSASKYAFPKNIKIVNNIQL